MIMNITEQNRSILSKGVKKWDKRFLSLAREISKWSKDPSTKVGAVITDDKQRIISLGYNGFPRQVNDTTERLNNREDKYQYTVHAEMNAMLFAQRDLTDARLYTWPFSPCANCTGAIIQSGIRTIISLIPTSEFNERWGQSFEIAKMMFEESHKTLFLYERQLWHEL